MLWILAFQLFVGLFATIAVSTFATWSCAKKNSKQDFKNKQKAHKPETYHKRTQKGVKAKAIDRRKTKSEHQFRSRQSNRHRRTKSLESRESLDDKSETEDKKPYYSSGPQPTQGNNYTQQPQRQNEGDKNSQKMSAESKNSAAAAEAAAKGAEVKRVELPAALKAAPSRRVFIPTTVIASKLNSTPNAPGQKMTPHYQNYEAPEYQGGHKAPAEECTDEVAPAPAPPRGQLVWAPAPAPLGGRAPSRSPARPPQPAQRDPDDFARESDMQYWTLAQIHNTVFDKR